ncbi:VOC family protein [Microbacterium sp. JZ31]|uniref:VOC family protein n=1 Tax=Microbacterium sp. JZ31 TaxID=1906274 RepID=UPI00193332FC|nr:VOC family protein [Microbacterium sp. JZ31]
MTTHQLRVVVEAEDYDAALRFYRDVLGLPEQESYHGDGDARVSILDAGRATLELSNPAQVRMIDRVETDGDRSERMRLAFEVDDTAATTDVLAAAGATVTATPRETPWRSLNARLRTPGDLQVTLFQELETLQERAARPGFRTEPDDVATVLDLERELQTSDLRHDTARLERLIAPDFAGIDDSGRAWDHAGIADALTRDAPAATDMQDLAGHAIADGVVLVTWASVRHERRARRSSLWRRDPDGWRLVHHQGTPLA